MKTNFKLIALLTFVGTAVAFSGASSQSDITQDKRAELTISPYGSPGHQVDSLHPTMNPQDRLSDEGFQFDPTQKIWRAKTRPLKGLLTNIKLGLERNGTAFTPQVVLSLPFQTQFHRVSIPGATISFDLSDINYAYSSLGTERDRDEWFELFVKSELLVRQLQGEADAASVKPSAVLARTLVVYAAAVTNLARKENWFGKPLLHKDRLTMINNIAKSEYGNIDFVRNALNQIQQLKHHITRRAWNNVFKRYSFNDHCSVFFPMARRLYKDLRAYSKAEYNQHFLVTRLQRDQVLSVAAVCFRKLLHFKNGEMFTNPKVVKESFDGQDAKHIASELIDLHNFELDTYSESNAMRARIGNRCQSVNYRQSQAEILYCDLLFLMDARDRIVPARDLERTSQNATVSSGS